MVVVQQSQPEHVFEVAMTPVRSVTEQEAKGLSEMWHNPRNDGHFFYARISYTNGSLENFLRRREVTVENEPYHFQANDMEHPTQVGENSNDEVKDVVLCLYIPTEKTSGTTGISIANQPLQANNTFDIETLYSSHLRAVIAPEEYQEAIKRLLTELTQETLIGTLRNMTQKSAWHDSVYEEMLVNEILHADTVQQLVVSKEGWLTYIANLPAKEVT